MCSCRMPAKDERKIKFCKNYFVLYVSLISLNFQELFIFMVKGKITMYRIIFFIRQLNILIKKKKKNHISIAIFPKKKKKKA